MTAIAKCRSEEQKERWLGPMARLEKIGAFALTEPEHGSDSVSLETTASPDGESYVISGNKKWIGNGSIADVVVVWAESGVAGRRSPSAVGAYRLCRGRAHGKDTASGRFAGLRTTGNTRLAPRRSFRCPDPNLVRAIPSGQPGAAGNGYGALPFLHRKSAAS